MNKYNILPYTAGTIAALLLSWFAVSFFDVAFNNINGGEYLPFNAFIILEEVIQCI